MNQNQVSRSERGSFVYYQEHDFNPVPIEVEDRETWRTHFSKRRNLYQRHLGIPISLLRGLSICEFGCNSGENALVLASVGASLTLVEPNSLVHPRLMGLFNKFGLEKSIVALIETDINSFERQTKYDMVIAEGFLYTLPNRDEMLQKLCNFLVPGGLGVITYVDRYGSLLEMTKRMLLWRTCELSGVDDLSSEASLNLARQMFADDFSNINASRAFESWWEDALVAPYFPGRYLWSFPEILPLIESAGCEFYSSSPRWHSSDHLRWYKDVDSDEKRRGDLLADSSRAFVYDCTGLKPLTLDNSETPQEVLSSVWELVSHLSDYSVGYAGPIEAVAYPQVVSQFFEGIGDPRLAQFNLEMEHIFRVARTGNCDDLLSAYHGSTLLRQLWGTTGSYVCFSKPIVPPGL